jgi:putative ABC transport system permease protein
LTFLTDLRRDVRHALRQLRRTPGFATIAIVTLGLGTGSSTAIFSVIDAVILRPLRFPESHELVMIRPSSGSRVSAGYLHEWRLESGAFRELAGWLDVRVNLTGNGPPREVLADSVTTNFFAMLGAQPALGRTFTTNADLSRVEREVVLSHGFWQRQFGGELSAVGRSIRLDDELYTIVGVMPAGSAIRTTELVESRAELWLPYRLAPTSRVGMGGALHVVGRLAPGMTPAEAREALMIVARRLEAENPSFSRDWTVNVVPLLEATVRDARPVLLVLFGGSGILLLIASVNVANLALSRALSRHNEFIIRLSIGATAGRLARQVLTEHLVLAVIGGTLGVLVAAWGVQALLSVLPPGVDLPRVREIGMDPRIMSAGVLVTLVTGAMFGLIPAISAARRALRAAPRGAVAGLPGGAGRRGMAHALIVSQVSLAAVLLVGAGLLARSFMTLMQVEPGFQAEQVITLRTTLPAAKYDSADRIRAFGEELLRRVSVLPGVSAAGSINYLPLSHTAGAQGFRIAGRTYANPNEYTFALTNVAGGRYFEAMGIPLLRGRFPNDADTAGRQPVFVIDEGLARKYWPDSDPLGVHLTWGISNQKLSGPIVGVVGPVRWTGMASNPWDSAYFWFPQSPRREISIVARTTSDPGALATAIAAQVRAIDPDQPVADIRLMTDLVAADLARPRFSMLLLGAFAAAALLLAAVGLYGVMAFVVTGRTREIGVRMALGAGRRTVLRLVLRQGAQLIALGVLFGIGAALALGRFVSALLYGITPTDLPTLVAVAVFLAGVALIAVYLPARRAARVDPMTALRAE